MRLFGFVSIHHFVTLPYQLGTRISRVCKVSILSTSDPILSLSKLKPNFYPFCELCFREVFCFLNQTPNIQEKTLPIIGNESGIKRTHRKVNAPHRHSHSAAAERNRFRTESKPQHQTASPQSQPQPRNTPTHTRTQPSTGKFSLTTLDKTQIQPQPHELTHAAPTIASNAELCVCTVAVPSGPLHTRPN